jgi:hypothetical protein
LGAHASVSVAVLVFAWKDWRGVSELERASRTEWQVSPGGVSLGGRASGNLQQVLTTLRKELSMASGNAARIAALNEATTEFEGLLGATRMAAVGFRVCGASGIAAACLTAVEAPMTALLCAVSGLVCGGVTWQLGRMADSSRAGLRDRWNGLIRRSSGSFPEAGSLVPTTKVQRKADENHE